jgi:HSP20 family protein
VRPDVPGTRSSYLVELDSIQRRLHQLFESALLTAGFDGGSGAPGTWSPQVDLVETARAYEIHAEMPGVKLDDVTVDVVPSETSSGAFRVEISGHRSPIGDLHDDPQFLQMERSDGPFRRSFDLATAVDPGAMTVRLEHGVLLVNLPKA